MEFDWKQRDAIIRTVWSEAAGEPDEGKAAVAWNIRNRLSTGKWGKTPLEVVSAKHQYEGWKDRAHKMDEASEEYALIGGIVDKVFNGEIEDPTKGALNFYAPKAQAELSKKDGRKLVPDWAKDKEPTAIIGGHVFFNPMFGETEVTPTTFKQGEGENSTQLTVPPIKLSGWGGSGEILNSFGGTQGGGKIHLGTRLGQGFLDGLRRGVLIPRLDAPPATKQFNTMLGVPDYNTGVKQQMEEDKKAVATGLTEIASDDTLSAPEKVAKMKEINTEVSAEPLSRSAIRKQAAMNFFPPEIQTKIADQWEYNMRKAEADQMMFALIDGGDFKDVPESLLKERPWLKDFVKLNDPNIDVNSFGDFLKWMNTRDANPNVKVDWGMVWEHLLKGEFSPQAEAAMRAGYGADWRARIASGIAAELGVDAAAFAIAMMFPPAAAAMGVAKGAALAARFKAAVTRSVFFAATGTSYQTIMDAVTGHERTAQDTLTDFGIRAVGGLGAEGVAAAVSKGLSVGKDGITKGVEAARDLISKQHNVKFYTPDDAAKAAANSSIFKAQMDASAHAYTKEAHNLKAQILQGAPNDAKVQQSAEQLSQIRKEIARQYKMTEEEADIAFALGDKVYGMDIFDGLGDKAKLQVINDYQDALRTKIDLGKQKAKLEAKLDRLKDPKKRAATQTQIENINNDLIRNEEHISGITVPYHQAINSYTSGSQLVDNIAMGNAIGPRYIGDTVSRQKAVDDMYYTYFTKDGQYQFQSSPTLDAVTNPSKLNPAFYTKKLKEWIRMAEPTATPYSEFAGEAGRAEVRTAMARQRLQNMLDSAIGNLNSKSSRRVWSAIEEGAEEAKLYNQVELGLKGLTPDEQDAYYAMRKFFDRAYELEDRRLLFEAQQKGYTNKWKGDPVKVDASVGSAKGITITPEMAAEGFIRVEPLNRTLSEFKGWQLARQEELKPLTSVLDYEAGYVPIGYKNANWHVSVFDPVTGEVSRIAGFRYAREMEAFKKQIQEENRYPGKVIVGLQWDDAGNFQSMGVIRSQMSVLESLDDKTYQKMIDNLMEQGVPKEHIDRIGNAKMLADVIDAMTLRRPHVGARADQRLQGTVELKPSSETTADYLSHVARQYGFGNFRVWATDQWRKKYADVLDPNERSWISDRVFQDVSPFDTQRYTKLKEAKRARAYLIHALTSKTKHEIQIDNFLKFKEAQLAKSDGGKALLGLIEKTPMFSTFVHESRGAVATARLGLLNMAHIVIQGQQGLVNYFTNPIYASRATHDIMDVIAAATKEKWTKIPLTKHEKQLMYVWRKNGYLSELDIAEWTALAESRFNPALAAGGKALENMKKISTAPFRAGEGINRMLAFATSRQWALDKLAKGELVDKTGKKFTGLADSDEFLDIVVERAKHVAFNMSRTGTVEAAKGAGAVLLQFKSIIGKATNLFETTALTPREKFGAAVGLVTLSGSFGIPLMQDMYEGVQWLTWHAFFDKDPSSRYWMDDGVKEMYTGALDWAFDTTGGNELLRDLGYDPNQVKQFVTDFSKKGLPYAIWDGNVDLVNRISFSAFITEMLNFSNNPMDIVPILGLAEDVYGALKRTDQVHLFNIPFMMELATTNDVDTFVAKYEEMVGLSPSEDLVQMWSAWGKALSYPGSLYRLYEMHKDPEALARSTGGTALPIKGADVEMSWQLLFGITPGDINAIYEKKEKIRTLKALGKEFEQNLEDKIRSARTIQEANKLYNDGLVVWDRYIDMLNENDVDTKGMRDNISSKMVNIWLKTRVFPDPIKVDRR